MSINKLLLTLLMALLLTSIASAGSRGFIVVMVNIGDDGFFESPIYKAYRAGEQDDFKKVEDCWKNGVTSGEGLMHTTRKQLPSGMTKELAQAIWNGDKKALFAAKKILHKGDTFTKNHEGYDGMYILQPKGNSMTLMAVGTRDKMPSKKITISFDSNSTRKTATEFELGLCHVSGSLEAGFGV